jgi:hypothetical protein
MSWSRSARPLMALALAAWLSPVAPAQVAYFDDFNDGNDTTPAPAWGHYQPLAALGFPGTWSFPSGGYRIQAASSGNTANPGRVASVRDQVNYTSFFVAADLVNWNSTVPQSFGLAARLRELGFTTTDGYLFLHDTNATNNFNIYRVTNEGVTSVGNGRLTLSPGTSYRFTFQGDTAGNLTGQVFASSAPATPLLTVTATDTQYPSGFSGLLVAEDTSGAISGGDATFDNFFAGPAAPVPEPGALALTGLAVAAGWAARRRQAKAWSRKR